MFGKSWMDLIGTVIGMIPIANVPNDFKKGEIIAH
jgi:hypothetical protein